MNNAPSRLEAAASYFQGIQDTRRRNAEISRRYTGNDIVQVRDDAAKLVRDLTGHAFMAYRDLVKQAYTTPSFLAGDVA